MKEVMDLIKFIGSITERGNKKMRCEGRRKPGIFNMGAAPVWTQCNNEAIVLITVKQEEIGEWPTCEKCWQEAIDRGMKIIKVEPILKEELCVTSKQRLEK